MAESKSNPFDQFDAPPDSGTAKGNPFDQFDAAPDTAASARPAPPASRVIGGDVEGNPIFEDAKDNAAVAAVQKAIPLGVLRSLRDVPDAGAQLLTRGLEAVAPAGSDLEKWVKGQRENVEAINRTAEKDYQENWRPEGTQALPDVGRMGGNMAAAAPIAAAIPGAAAASLPIRMMAGAAAGAATGALQPSDVPEGEFWQEKGKQAAIGAGGGAVAPAIGSGIARLIAPNTTPAVGTLMNAGVTPTPGQILGGVFNRLEEAAQSIPFVGDAIKAARSRAVDDLNRAAINRALTPIGESLDSGTPLGREAISEMHDKITANYDRLVPQLSVQADPQFVQGIRGPVMQARARLSDPAQEQLDRILKNDIFNKFDPNSGGMTGEDFKVADSELKRQIRSYANSSVASDRDVGRALSEVHSQMSDLLKRSNPARVPELNAADEAYANAVRVEGAAAKPGGDQGVFTPAQLLQSIRQTDPTLRKGAFARGQALMQDLGDAGKAVLGNKVPDSGTMLRAMVAGPTGLAGLAGLYAVNPLAAAGAAGTAATAMGAYTRPGVNTLATLLARRPASAPAVARLMRNPALATLPAVIAADRSRASAGP